LNTAADSHTYIQEKILGFNNSMSNKFIDFHQLKSR